MERTENSVTKALGRAHKALLADLRDLERAVSPTSGEAHVELRTRLERARAHLTEHFGYEEQKGYMDVVRKREPRLERAIQQLAEEHGQLRQSLDGLIGQAGTATGLNDNLRELIREWIERVRRHEIRENDLVQDAFNLDIGAED